MTPHQVNAMGLPAGLTMDGLREVLDAALGRVDVTADAAVGLEGSLAEGFGNDTSDVDFIVYVDIDEPPPVMPTVLFVDGRRVEVRVTTRAAILGAYELAERMAQYDARGVTEDDLDRCQRFLGSVPLRNEDTLDRAKALCDRPTVDRAIASWYRQRTIEACGAASARLAFGDDDGLRLTLVAVAQLATKSWLAGMGESYVASKWMHEQLDRLGAHDVEAEYREVVRLANGIGGDVATTVAAVEAFAARLGIHSLEIDPDALTVARRPGVTSWTIGTRVHVIRAKSDVFVLGDEAAEVWRHVVFGSSIRELVRSVDGRAPAAEILDLFHQLGLFELTWRGRRRILGSRRTGMPTVAATILLSADGGCPATRSAPAPTHVAQLPLSAPVFAELGMTLVWSNVVIENAVEDAVGARGAAQWGAVGWAVRRVVREACLVVASAHGVYPVPALNDVSSTLKLLPALEPEVVDEVLRLEREQDPTDRRSADDVMARAASVALALRRHVGMHAFPESFSSASAWRETLELGYDWIRLGAYLDAAFPIDQARDLIASGGAQPTERAAGKMEAVASSRRRVPVSLRSVVELSGE